MSSHLDELDEEHATVLKCQQGDPAALTALYAKHQGVLLNILLARGATREEAQEVLADVWAECVAGRAERLSLLEKFKGNCRLQSWLATVATRRWFDRKRREKFRGEPPASTDESSHTGFFGRVPAPSSSAREGSLVDLLRDSLQAAFAACAPQALVMLRLRYVHGLSQRELMRMVGWSEAKVSRYLSQALDQIRDHTLREIKQRDAWLELTWEDFQDLCATEEVGIL